MENILENLDGWYNAHHGLSDFYEKSEAVLRAALESGEDFYAEWGCKKEIHYVTVTREGDRLTITARAYNDELREITDTVIWVAAGRNDFAGCGFDALAKIYGIDPEDEDSLCAKFDEFVDLLSEDYQECHEHVIEFPCPVNWETFIAALDKAESEAETAAYKNYEGLVESVKFFIAHERNEEADHYAELERGYNQDRI